MRKTRDVAGLNLQSVYEGGKKEVAAVYNRKEMLVRVPMTDTLNIKFTFYEKQGV